MSKKKEKDGTTIVGNLIKAKTAKSRLSKENKDVTVRLYYDERGLDRYYGLLELGEIGGLWKNVAGRYEMTVDGKCFSEDSALAAEWYRKSAEQGNAVAQQQLGILYYLGEGVPEDHAQAGEWLGQAAAQGHPLTPDRTDDLWHLIGTEWLRKAADQGTAIAQRLMGDLYRDGEGVRKDAALAAEWYRKAATQDDREALTCLGAMLHEDKGLL